MVDPRAWYLQWLTAPQTKLKYPKCNQTHKPMNIQFGAFCLFRMVQLPPSCFPPPAPTVLSHRAQMASTHTGAAAINTHSDVWASSSLNITVLLLSPGSAVVEMNEKVLQSQHQLQPADDSDWSAPAPASASCVCNLWHQTHIETVCFH